jgi:hypothetical protein
VSDNPISENGIQVPDTAPDVANAPTQVAQTADNANDVASKTDDGDADDTDDLKKKKNITLAQKVSHVTVILPTKNN